MIKNLKSYPEYKESNSPWLGEFPVHWRLPRLGSVLRERGETNEKRQMEQVLSVMKDVGVIPYEEKGRVGNKKSEDTARYKIVRPDDIVVNCMNVIIGSVGISRYTGCLSPVYYVLTRRSDVNNPRYLNSIFQTKPFQLSLVRIGKGIMAHRMRISMELLKCEPFPVPPRDEQDAIVRFLDYVNGRIELAIRAKRKLIELLNEQKRAITHSAITRGLDPNVSLKPSGIRWLGDIPKDWQTRRLKSISQIRYGLGQPPRETETGLPLIRATNVDQGRILENNLVRVDPSDVPKTRNAFLNEGEIIVVRSGALTGDSAIIPKKYQGAVAGYDMVVTVTRARPDFVALSLLSSYLREDQLVIASTRAAQPHLNAEELGAAIVLVPSDEEQKRIVKFVETETGPLDNAISRAEREMELLREFGIRLATDAVTGKIDVRDVASKLDETADEPEASATDDEPGDNCIVSRGALEGR